MIVTVETRDPERLKLALATLVFLEGIDITNLCFEADNDPADGWVSMWVLDPHTQDPNDPPRVTVHGHVVFRERIDPPRGMRRHRARGTVDE